ncbi:MULTISPECIES: RCC1 domain-containing protein [unclassified Paenibacillus]|uniref:RCC1 domain-containing protein n=1 Tax=unclassified Paenibacillus TaxID=185978 RepID=UPI003627DA40
MLIQKMTDRLRSNLPGQSLTKRLVQLSLCICFLLSALMSLPEISFAYGTSESNSGFKAVSAGYSHTTAVKSDGTVWTWGANDHGQLGYDTSGADQTSPRQVTGLPSNIVSIAAGGNPETGAASSAFTLAIDANGYIYSWGSNEKGQLGDGTTFSRLTFARVKTSGGTDLVVPNGKLSAGFDYAGVLDPISGKAWIWGDNQFGQLSNQDTGNKSLFPVPVKTNQSTELSGITELSLGGRHGLALKDGIVYSWGSNDRGQLGTDAPLESTSPYASAIQSTFTNRNVGKIAAGSYHSVAIVISGTGEGSELYTKLWSWGDNTVRQLGIDRDRLVSVNNIFTDTYSAYPRPADFYYNSYALLNNPAALAAGGKQLIILDILNGGTELEYFEGDNGSIPGRNENLTAHIGEVIAVAAGHQQTFALTASGKLWGKGINDHGQLGLGDSAFTSINEFTQPLFPLPSELKSLTAAEGTLTPAFKHYGYSYSLNVGTDTSEVHLSAEASYPDAKEIKLGQTVVPASQLSDFAVPVSYGLNAIMVQVTGGDNSTTTYTLQINRAFPDKEQLTQTIVDTLNTHDKSSEGILPGQYRTGAKAELMVAIQAAQAVNANPSSSQAAINDAKAALMAAREVFNNNLSPDRQPMFTLLSLVQEVYNITTEGTAQGQYQAGARNELLNAIHTATAARDNAALSQADLTAAVAALQTAWNDFELKEVPLAPVAFLNFEGNNGGFISNDLWSHATLTAGDLHAHSGSKVWALNLAGSVSGNHKDTLISPDMDLTSNNVQGFRISWWQFNSPILEYTNLVFVSKDGGANWDFIPINFVPGGNWAKRSFELDASYAVKNFKFKIETATSNLVPAAMLIDDVKIERFSTNFNQSITDAQKLHQSSVEGTGSGLYASGSKAQLQQAISNAIAVRDSNPGFEAVDAAVVALKQAVQNFQASKYLPGTLYSNNFENTPCGFERSGTSESWQCGTPTIGPKSGHSGNKAWGTNLSGVYAASQKSDLTSPVIDLSSASTDAPLTLTWWQWAQTEQGYDGLRVSISKNGGNEWTQLLDESGGEERWVQKRFTLDPSYAVADFRMKFHFYSDSSVQQAGVFVDDIIIDQLNTSSLLNEIWQAQHLLEHSQEGNSVGYYETGAKAPLNAALLNGQTVAFKAVLTQNELDNALAPIQQAIAQFKTKVKQPNFLYNSDFEANNGGFTSGGTISSWQYGVPQSGPMQAASGTKLWATNLTGNFYSNEDSYIISPPIQPSPTEAWKLSVNWMQWVQLRSCCGSIKVEASKDAGVSWQTLFTQRQRGEIEGPSPESVMSSSWQPMQVELDPSYNVEGLKIRFALQWNANTSPGWYIDDVRVTAYPKDLGYTVSEAEGLISHTLEGTGVGNYSAGSKAELQLHINSTKAVLQNPGSTTAQMLTAQSSLNEAIQQYRSKYVSGLLNQLNKGSYVELGGKKWLLWDPGQNGLLLGMDDVYKIGSKSWSNESESSIDCIKYAPAKTGSLAYYLNADFYNSLSSQKDWIDNHSWDVRDNSGAVVYGTDGTVEAKVGLLNTEQYKALSDKEEYGGDGTLRHEEWQEYDWWLLTPRVVEQNNSEEDEYGQFVHIVDSWGNIYFSQPQSEYAVRPAVHLNPSIGVISGTGAFSDPYRLTMLSNAKELTKVTSSHGTTTSVAGDYQVEVPYSVSSVKLTWELSPQARIGNVTGAVYDSNGWVVSLPDPGIAYEIKVPIFAQDNTVAEHKITVTRNLSSSDASLSVASNTGTVENVGADSFKIKVAHDVTSVSLTPTVHNASAISIIGGTVTGAVYNGGVITIPELLVGNNTLQLKVTAEDGTTNNYSISIIRLSNDANLSSLIIGGTPQSLIANQASQSITVNVPYTMEGLNIAATVADATAKLRIDGQDSTSGKPFYRSLNVGDNTLAITVTAADETKTYAYQIVINRAADTSNDATVTSVSYGNILGLRSGNTFSFTMNSVTQSVYFYIQPTVSSAQLVNVSGNVTGVTYGRKGTGYELYVPMLRNDAELTFKIRSANGSTEASYSIKIISGAPLGQPQPVSSVSPTITFTNGVTVDLSSAALGPDARLTVTQSSESYSNFPLTLAGDILDFTLTGATIDQNHPVRLEFPITPGSDKSRVGIFHYNKTKGTWEYQPTVITADGRAVAFVTHFSTYGVFGANQVAAVQPTETRLANGETEITLTTATAGSDVIIYYTLNNTPPTSGSLVYDPANKPKLAANQTLQAFAAKPSMLNSVVTVVIARGDKVIDISYVLQNILLKKDVDGKPGFTRDDVLQLLQLIQPRVVTPTVQVPH